MSESDFDFGFVENRAIVLDRTAPKNTGVRRKEIGRIMFVQNSLHLILIDSELRVSEFFINGSGPRRPPR